MSSMYKLLPSPDLLIKASLMLFFPINVLRFTLSFAHCVGVGTKEEFTEDPPFVESITLPFLYTVFQVSPQLSDQAMSSESGRF